MPAALKLSFAPSRHLAALLLASHGVTIAAVWAMDAAAWVKILLTLSLIASCAFYLRTALLRSAHSVTGMVVMPDGTVDVALRDGSELHGRLVPGGFVHPGFTTILWLPEKARFARAVPVLPDSLPTATFRELRVWLKWRVKGEIQNKI
jgi:hypothetical protein